MLFFIELQSRRVRLAGCTSNPNGSWVTQQARNLTMELVDRKRPPRFAVHDRDAKFSAAFDEVFRTEGVEIIRAPVKASNANAHAERFIRTVRSDCLDWLLIFGRRQLECVLREYVNHYNRERPHRALELRAPDCSPETVPLRPPSQIAVRRRDRLGGLIHEYALAA